jgi:hypothetical protein
LIAVRQFLAVGDQLVPGRRRTGDAGGGKLLLVVVEAIGE